MGLNFRINVNNCAHLVTNVKWMSIQLATAYHLLDIDFAVTITSENQISKMNIIFFKGYSFSIIKKN